ncbi:MAG: cation transporter [Deltaproteobacteria bacterium]|nr:cation transporter [Deltaproteobacteria bacterium]
MAANLKKRALLLSYFTIGYNVVECLLALLAGMLSGSIALVGFGLDSLLECLSGGVMIWRFYPHRNLSEAEEALLERRAIKIIGYTFFVLAAYIFYESVEKSVFAEPPSPSLLGICIALVSSLLMPALYLFKLRTGGTLGSASLKADSKQTMACGLLSVALLIGLGLNYFFGLWQADPVIGLLIAVFLVKEGYRAVQQGKLCTCAACGLPPGPPETLDPSELTLLD